MKHLTSFLVSALSLSAFTAAIPTVDTADAIPANLTSSAPATCQGEVNPIDRPRSTLEQFAFNLFYGTVITNDPEIFRASFELGYCKDVVVLVNGVTYDYNQFMNYILIARATNTYRRLKFVDFNVVADDSSGLTGNVGYTAGILAIQDGVPVRITVTSTLTIKKDDCGNQKVSRECLVAEVQPDHGALNTSACAWDDKCRNGKQEFAAGNMEQGKQT